MISNPHKQLRYLQLLCYQMSFAAGFLLCPPAIAHIALTRWKSNVDIYKAFPLQGGEILIREKCGKLGKQNILSKQLHLPLQALVRVILPKFPAVGVCVSAARVSRLFLCDGDKLSLEYEVEVALFSRLRSLSLAVE